MSGHEAKHLAHDNPLRARARAELRALSTSAAAPPLLVDDLINVMVDYLPNTELVPWPNTPDGPMRVEGSGLVTFPKELVARYGPGRHFTLRLSHPFPSAPPPAHLHRSYWEVRVRLTKIKKDSPAVTIGAVSLPPNAPNPPDNAFTETRAVGGWNLPLNAGCYASCTAGTARGKGQWIDDPRSPEGDRMVPAGLKLPREYKDLPVHVRTLQMMALKHPAIHEAVSGDVLGLAWYPAEKWLEFTANDKFIQRRAKIIVPDGEVLFPVLSIARETDVDVQVELLSCDFFDV